MVVDGCSVSGMETGFPRMLSVDDVADTLNVSRATVERLIGLKLLQSVKIGSRRLVTQDALREYLDGLDTAG
jgi:excisionase family DNA binding protein